MVYNHLEIFTYIPKQTLWSPFFIIYSIIIDQNKICNRSVICKVINIHYLRLKCQKRDSALCHIKSWINTNPDKKKAACQRSLKTAPTLYEVLVQWLWTVPSCELSVVLEPSPSLCTSKWAAFLNFLH